MSEPTDIDALVAEARKLLFSDSAFGYEDTKEGDLIFRLADALTAVSAERDRLDESFDRDLPWRYSEVLEQVKTMRADRDRLHKAITEALEAHAPGRTPDTWVMYDDPVWRILRAALGKEGEGDGHDAG